MYGHRLFNNLVTLAVLAFLFWSAPQAQANDPDEFDPVGKWEISLFDLAREKLIKIATFPQTGDYQDTNGIHFDAGLVFKQVRIAHIPLWNYDVRWCGYYGDSDGHYFSISEDKLKELARSAGVRLAAKPPIPDWDSKYGKMILGFFLLGILQPLLDKYFKKPNAEKFNH